jgi:hypothetical protein
VADFVFNGLADAGHTTPAVKRRRERVIRL